MSCLPVDCPSSPFTGLKGEGGHLEQHDICVRHTSLLLQRTRRRHL
ncbi:uncharacterized protein RCC_06441 [Ramularia collo-cygni]|uniref:Uncharacterized protein n=1 Tax=Ramularia collo-cygni TaxID=112498 RepID=A0A2D3VID9_9PEZI|nr:uncharacterized protein RCC_06441 [Ramularia collo-cygni]CZT20583.1 uncharacterized protein RCC_06441 [Ramularia collo-cygni]